MRNVHLEMDIECLNVGGINTGAILEGLGMCINFQQLGSGIKSLGESTFQFNKGA